MKEMEGGEMEVEERNVIKRKRSGHHSLNFMSESSQIQTRQRDGSDPKKEVKRNDIKQKSKEFAFVDERMDISALRTTNHEASQKMTPTSHQSQVLSCVDLLKACGIE